MTVPAVVADGTGQASIRDVAAPNPGSGQALVEVEAVSLNRGVLNRIRSARYGWRPGWDLAGRVVRPAGDGPRPVSAR